MGIKFKNGIVCLGKEKNWPHKAFEQQAKGAKNEA